jgi:hypothetical protein
MGNYIAHRPLKRRELRQTPQAPADERATVEVEHQARITERLARRGRIAHKRRADLDARAARLEQRQERAQYWTQLERRAERLFPWDLLQADRKIAAALSGDLRTEALYPILDMAKLFAVGALKLDPRDHGVKNEELARFIKLAAPQTRSARALGEVAGFWLDMRRVEAGQPPVFGDGFDETFPDKIVAATRWRIGAVIDSVERRLATLPNWLCVRQLNDDWFVIRPTPETAAEIWDGARRACTAH